MREKMRGRILAIDYGTKRIGLAVSDALGIAAHPLPYLTHKSWTQVFSDIRKIAQEKMVELLLVGLPLAPDGGEGTQAKSCREFAAKLEKTAGLPVILADETMTSREAKDILVNEMDLSREKRKRAIDSLAACILLKSYLERHPK